MSKRNPKGRKKGPAVSGDTKEDASLWAYVTRDLQPAKLKPRVPMVEPQPIGDRTVAGSRGRGHKAPAHQRVDPGPALQKNNLHPATGAGATQNVNGLDRRRVRRIKTGRLAIEGRIDLHGLRQSEARSELVRFIHRAVTNGQRLLLIITGKGRTPKSVPFVEQAVHQRSEHGVLKQMVPIWLSSDPEIAHLILSWRSADPRHGGEGALYVELRNPKRIRAR